jgi:hypothetical protein
MQRPIPLRPDYSARARNNWLERSVVASAISVAVDDPTAGGPAGIAKRMWGDGSVVDAICKAAVVPTSTSTASAFAGSAVADFVASLQPISAGAKLIAAAPRVSLDGIASLTVPARSGAIPSADEIWVDEGSPLPVAQMSLTNAATLTPKKLAVQAVLTRELATYSAGETVITQMLRESAAVALDASIFSTTAVSTARPAGILNGIAAKTATAGGGDTAMMGDLELLSGAIADAVSGLAYVCHPRQANAIKLRRGKLLPDDIQVWATLGVAPGVVICLDPQAFVSGFSAEPEIKVAAHTLVHMEDTTPLPVGTVGTPPTVAAPLRSTFQTDTLAIKLVLQASWGWRVPVPGPPTPVAWLTSATWGS